MTTSNSAPPITSSSAIASPSSKRKPRISLAIATALGLGYIPKAPGTFGSLAGIALATWLPYLMMVAALPLSGGLAGIAVLFAHGQARAGGFGFDLNYFALALFLIVSVVGVWTASRVAAYLGSEDPQIIVIDEVSGQYLTLLVGGLWPGRFEATRIFGGPHSFGNFGALPLNWKCVLAGFILFRVFDIWKPFPARQAESLPRGWGIMADDWIAGLYAALGLWILRAAGL
jgi:phosphatidylglycerophosphatase A